MNKRQLGSEKEKLAAEYLQERGYEIVTCNYRCRQAEIDIIAKDHKSKEIVFVEVKTRTNKQYGNPIDAVNNLKQKHLIKTIEYYVYSKHLENEFIRIDVIEVYFNNGKYMVNHIKQVI